MDKYIYDESNGLWYELQGDYYIPCLTLPAEKENKPISLWGQRHKHYLQEHKRTVYISLLTSGELNNYLADIDEQATEMMFRLVEHLPSVPLRLNSCWLSLARLLQNSLSAVR